jgi:hypothetical protein
MKPRLMEQRALTNGAWCARVGAAILSMFVMSAVCAFGSSVAAYFFGTGCRASVTGADVYRDE